MKNLQGPFLVDVTLVNATEKYQFGYFPPGEEFGPYVDLKSLFKAMKEEWGSKCTGMYRDTKTGTKQVGWVFKKRVKYDGGLDSYLREAWVEVIREKSPAVAAVYETVDVGGAA